MGLYNFWTWVIVGKYIDRNSHRSLAAALQNEAEWEKIKPKDDDDDDEEDEEEE